jgi:hypothetical protein
MNFHGAMGHSLACYGKLSFDLDLWGCGENGKSVAQEEQQLSGTICGGKIACLEKTWAGKINVT